MAPSMRSALAGLSARAATALGALAALVLLGSTGIAQGVPSGEGPAQETEDAPLSIRVNLAIARGVQNLLEAQGSDGLWRGHESRFPGGLTAFVSYTLIKSGVRRGDRQLTEALRALAEIEPRSTYGTSARLLLYQSLGDRDAWAPRAEACLANLVDFQREGLWGYPEDPIDFSNVQFALLGLRAAHDMGIEVPERTLVDAAKQLWRFADRDTGGVRYHDAAQPTGGITAAALGSMALLDGFAEDSSALARVLSKHKKARASAHEFLVERWDPERNAWGPRAWTPAFHHAYLWAVQRYCELTGATHLGEHDWYVEGAEHLVATQQENGAWGEQIHDTCFALLFLRQTTFSGGRELEELYNGAAESAEIARKPRVVLSGDAPWLTTCLAAGPIRGKGGDSKLFDPPFDPAKLKPRAGAKVARAKWELTELVPTDWTDLERVTERRDDGCLWLVAADLVAEGGEDAPPREALLWLALEDGYRVFLNGEELARSDRVQAPIRPDQRVPAMLAPGPNRLIVLIEDTVGAAAFGMRLSDRDGKPLRGVTMGAPLKR